MGVTSYHFQEPKCVCVNHIICESQIIPYRSLRMETILMKCQNQIITHLYCVQNCFKWLYRYFYYFGLTLNQDSYHPSGVSTKSIESHTLMFFISYE